jgi:hypothetical protein
VVLREQVSVGTIESNLRVYRLSLRPATYKTNGEELKLRAR